jgi:hypothetical protein
MCTSVQDITFDSITLQQTARWEISNHQFRRKKKKKTNKKEEERKWLLSPMRKEPDKLFRETINPLTR